MSGILTVLVLLIVAAFICTIAEALGKCPGWIPVLLLCVAMMVQVLPIK